MKGAQQTVAGRIFIQKNNMPRLLPAKACSDLFHPLQNIAVTHFSLFYFYVVFISHQKESQVAHDRSYNLVVFQFSLVLHMDADDRHDLVSINNVANFIYCQQSVRISVKSQADIRFFIYHPCLQFFHMGRTAVGINICSVRAVMNGNNLSAQLLQCFNRSIIRCALGTVNHYLQSPQIDIYRFDRMIDIFFSCIRTVFDLSHAGAGRKFHILHAVPDQRFDLIFQFIGQFITVPVKKFDTVKFHGIMGGGNHHPCIHLIFPRQVCDCGSGKHPCIYAVRPYRTCSCHQRICQHVTGYSRITAHHNRRFMLLFLCQNICSCLAQLHSQHRGQFFIRNTSYSVSTK